MSMPSARRVATPSNRTHTVGQPNKAEWERRRWRQLGQCGANAATPAMNAVSLPLAGAG